MDQTEIRESIVRMASDIARKEPNYPHAVLLGIQKGGVPIARALAAELSSLSGRTIAFGSIDVSFYRDDLGQRLPYPEPTVLPTDINGRLVILADSVLFSGRTVVAACDALKDYGRAAAIRLAVLVDRGHRELPIAPDFVGKYITTEFHQKVRVRDDFVAVVTYPNPTTP